MSFRAKNIYGLMYMSQNVVRVMLVKTTESYLYLKHLTLILNILLLIWMILILLITVICELSRMMVKFVTA